jgi:uncharacterized lipoprotein YbaY
MTLHGRLHVPAGAADARGAVATVRLLEVSRADAASTTVAEVSFSVGAPGEDGIDFELDVPPLDARATYTLAAHVDLDHSGEVAVGDYVTVQHIGVDARDAERTFDVPLQRVT